MKQFTSCELAAWELEHLWELFDKTPEFAEEVPREKFNILLATGMIQLWVEPDTLTPVAAMVTEIRTTQNGKYVMVLAFAGENVDDERTLFASIKSWASKNGCTKIRGICKDAQARLFARDGFVKIAHVIELEV